MTEEVKKERTIAPKEQAKHFFLAYDAIQDLVKENYDNVLLPQIKGMLRVFNNVPGIHLAIDYTNDIKYELMDNNTGAILGPRAWYPEDEVTDVVAKPVRKTRAKKVVDPNAPPKVRKPRVKKEVK